MLCALALVALASAPDLAQYSRHSFTPLMPEASVLGLAVDADAALVVATEAGPFRFDGVHFVPLPWRAQAQGRVAQSVLVRGADVFVGSETALTRVRGGEVESWPLPAGCGGAVDLASDGRDELWLACFSGGVAHLTAGQVVQEAFLHLVHGLTFTADGTLWLGTDDGLFARPRGAQWHSWTERDGLPGTVVESVAARREGGVWVGTSQGLAVVDGAGHATPAGFEGRPIGPLLERPDGSLWGALRLGGLFRLAHGQVSEAHFHGTASVQQLVEDREGSVWVGSQSQGLLQLAWKPVQAVGADEGIAEPLAWAVAFDASGALWIGTDDSGLWRASGGQLRRFGEAEGLGEQRVFALLVDRRGALWVGTRRRGLFRLEGEHFVQEHLEAQYPDGSIDALLEDPDGTLWVGTEAGLAHRTADGVFHPIDAPARIEVTGLAWGRDHTLWVSSARGLWRLVGGRLERFAPTLGGSLSPVVVRDDGSLWVASSDRGVHRVDPSGQVSTCGEAQGLPANNVWTLLEGADHRWWMSSNRGLWRVDGAALERCLARQGALEPVRVYGARDGMRSKECNGGYATTAARGPGGALAFACVAGALLVDPSVTNAVPPTVRFDAVVQPEGAVPLDGRTSVEVGRGRVAFHFSVFSMKNPEGVEARFRLEGFDEGWQQADADREIVYTNLPPGRHRLRVVAANEDGVWNPEGAVLEVLVPPRLHERALFWPAVGALGALLVGGWLRARTRGLRAREAEVARLVAQRTTELERARDGAERAARARTEFLANISHEIRTPLNAIVGAAQLLKVSAGQAERDEYLGLLEEASEALLGLLNDVLDFSKLEAGRATAEARPFDLDALCAKVLEVLRPQAAKKRLGLTLEGSVGGAVLGDEQKLRQVLLNLVGNALKFTERGGVRLTMSQPAPGQVRFAVADSGIGLSAEQRGALFQPFSQADASISRRFGGTGLGLAISSRLVGLMGGALSVESAPGVGSTFSFTLPLPPAPTLADAARARPTVPRLKVLLVDDNPVNLRITGQMLKVLGQDVVTASDGLEAVERCQAERFTLVLIDLQMPQLDGFEATRRIFELVRPPPVVVALTANAIESDRQACLAAGMKAYLTKPLRLEALATVLEQVGRGEL